jgi:hypothetical protein
LRDAAGDVVAARRRAFLAKDNAHVVKVRCRAHLEPRPRDRDTAAGVGIEAEIYGLVLRKAAVERDVKHTGLPVRRDRRHAAERSRQFSVAVDDAHAAGPFGHQHAAVGQKGERPGMHKAAGQGFDFKFTGRGWEGLRRGRCGKRRQQCRQQ